MTQTRTRLERGRGALGPALTLVHTGRAPTRAVLTSELGVTRATAGAVAAELEVLGLIRVDTRPTVSAGAQGRPSHRLTVDPDGPVVLAVQVHADGFRAALVGLGGRIVATTPGCVSVPADPARVLGTVVEAGAELLRSTGRDCLGAGLAVPSAVAEPDGTALNPLHLAWPAGAPVREVFARQIAAHGITAPDGGPPACFVGNDVNVAALAEHRHGAGRGAQHLLVVATGHRGVGGALVLDGRLHTGSSGLALEVGHLTVNPEGAPCHCGSRGCLDVEVDPLAFLRAAGRDPGPEVSLLERSAALLRREYGDPSVRQAAARPHRPPRAGARRPGQRPQPGPDRPRRAAPPPARGRPGAAARGRGRPQPVGPQRFACRSSAARWTTTAWWAPPSWPGSRCSTTR